jgi:hypothetical protein
MDYNERNNQFRYGLDDPLLKPAEAAAVRRQAPSTFWRDVRAGLVPPAIYVSPRGPRWRLSELQADLDAKRAPAKGVADPKAA